MAKRKKMGEGRGGARPGAGRPRVEGGRQLAVVLGEEHWAEVERLKADIRREWDAQGRAGLVTAALAVRRALEMSAARRGSLRGKRT